MAPLRVGTIVHSESDGPWTCQRFLGMCEPLVQRAAAQGIRLIALPAQRVHLKEETYTVWLAQVRHWARQHHLWLVVGYTLEGEEPARSRLLVIGPDGHMRGGCDYGRWLTPHANFTGNLRWIRWSQVHLPFRGLVIVPYVSRGGGRWVTLLLRALTWLTRSMVIANGNDPQAFRAGSRVLPTKPSTHGERLFSVDFEP